jgi:hypothetical protein
MTWKYINKQKLQNSAGGIAEAVVCLSRKQEALSSNPSTIKNKQTKKKSFPK